MIYRESLNHCFDIINSCSYFNKCGNTFYMCSKVSEIAFVINIYAMLFMLFLAKFSTKELYYWKWTKKSIYKMMDII